MINIKKLFLFSLVFLFLFSFSSLTFASSSYPDLPLDETYPYVLVMDARSSRGVVIAYYSDVELEFVERSGISHYSPKVGTSNIRMYSANTGGEFAFVRSNVLPEGGSSVVEQYSTDVGPIDSNYDINYYGTSNVFFSAPSKPHPAEKLPLMVMEKVVPLVGFGILLISLMLLPTLLRRLFIFF